MLSQVTHLPQDNMDRLRANDEVAMPVIQPKLTHKPALNVSRCQHL